MPDSLQSRLIATLWRGKIEVQLTLTQLDGAMRDIDAELTALGTVEDELTTIMGEGVVARKAIDDAQSTLSQATSYGHLAPLAAHISGQIPPTNGVVGGARTDTSKVAARLRGAKAGYLNRANECRNLIDAIEKAITATNQIGKTR